MPAIPDISRRGALALRFPRRERCALVQRIDGAVIRIGIRLRGRLQRAVGLLLRVREDQEAVGADDDRVGRRRGIDVAGTVAFAAAGEQ